MRPPATHQHPRCCPRCGRDDPETLKEQLKEILGLEEAGKMNHVLRLKKKALQQAYNEAIKRKMVGGWLARSAGWGAALQSLQDDMQGRGRGPGSDLQRCSRWWWRWW